jgi:hypothetical protein
MSMTYNQKEVVFGAFLELEILVLEYRKAVLWLTQGNHETTPRPSVRETRELMSDLKGKITALLEVIEAKTQQLSELGSVISDSRK